MDDIGSFERGKRFVHADAVDKGIPCIHYGEIYTFYGAIANKHKSDIREDIEEEKKLRYAIKNDVVIVGAGENDIDIGIGVAWLGDYKIAVHDACYIFSHQQNPKYISYCLRTSSYHQQIKRFVSRGKICAISSMGIGSAYIYLPPIEKQNEIVEKLEKFDILVNDLVNGLPAEIEARQKQYEYYRDKLLTFKKLS